MASASPFGGSTGNRWLVPILIVCALLCALSRADSGEPVWTVSAAPPMNSARMGHESRLLPDGRVIVFGGHGSGFTALDSAEIWNPASGEFLPRAMAATHDGGALARLADGRYLLAGGAGDLGVAPGHSAAELFDPRDGSFRVTGSLQRPRMSASAATLADGSVLVVGGWYDDASAGAGERFDPASGTFALTGALDSPRARPVVLALDDGGALVLGGYRPWGDGMVETVERYDPAGNRFSRVRPTLFGGEAGWLLRASNFAPPPQLADGRYLLLAYRPGDHGSAYALFTVDPASGEIARQTPSPALQDSAVAAWFPPLFDDTTGVAYLLGQALDGERALLRLRLLDVTDWAQTAPSVSYRLPADYYLGSAAAVQLQDGRILVTGGHSERGASSNFSPVPRTLAVDIELPAPPACSFSLSSPRETLPAAGGSAAVTLTASDPACEWSAVSSTGWLTLDSAAGGSGSAVVPFTVAANATDVPRMAVLTIAGRNLVVLQPAAGAATLVNGTEAGELLQIDEQTRRVEGHGGSDTLQLPAFPNAFALTRGEDGVYRAEFLGRSLDIVGVEQLRFGATTHTTVPIEALLSGELQEQVARLTDLYLAFFGRAPDVGGLEYWVHQLLQGGRDFASIAKGFAWSAEAQALFPKSGSNREFVRAVYLNVFDREPDPGGWDYWTAKLDALGETDLSDRGEFVARLLLGAYAPTSGAGDRELLINRHDVALDYANRLALQPQEGFDAAINDLLAGVDLAEDSVQGAGQVLDYVFGSDRSLGEIVEDPAMLDTIAAVDVRIDWEADARRLPATVTLPRHSPLQLSEARVSILFEDYAPDANGNLELPVPSAPYADAFVMLPLPGTADYVVYLMATVLEGQASVEFSAEATAVELILNGIDREYLEGGLTPAQIRETIRDEAAAFIDAFVAALNADPFYLRPDNLDAVYGEAFQAALVASREALAAQLEGGSVVFSVGPSSEATVSEGLTVLPQVEQYDFKVFPARAGLIGYGDMTGELLLQNDSMLPARYATRDALSGQVLHYPPSGLFGDLLSPQSSLLYGYNAGSASTDDTHFHSTRLLIFTPGAAPYRGDDEWLAAFAPNMGYTLNERLLLDNIITVLSNLIPVSDQSFYIPWFQWIGDQGWFQAAADKLYAERDLSGAIRAFATGMANPDNLKATLKYAMKYYAKSIGVDKLQAKLVLKSQARWLFKITTWKAKVMIYAADLASTVADLNLTPSVIEFDLVAFPLYLEDYRPRGLSKVPNPDGPRRVTFSGGGLAAFSAGGDTHEPRVYLQAKNADGEDEHYTITPEHIYATGSGGAWFELPFEWMDIGSDIVGPIHFQIEHAFVDPYTGSVIDSVRIPPSAEDPAYRIEIGADIVVTGTSRERVTRGEELVVFGSGFAIDPDDNTVTFIDHGGQRADAIIDYVAEDHIALTAVPGALAIGPLEIEVLRRDGSRSNRYPLTLRPLPVSAEPPAGTDFDSTLSVRLSQEEDLPIHYSIDSGADQAYFTPLTLDRTANLYAYAVEVVDGVEYRSATGGFFYYRCAEDEILQDGECVPVLGPGEHIQFSHDYRWSGGSASTWPDELTLALGLDLLVNAEYTPDYPRSIHIADPVFSVDEAASSLRPTVTFEIHVPFSPFEAPGNRVSVSGSVSMQPSATGGSYFDDEGDRYEWELEEGPFRQSSCAALGEDQDHFSVSGDHSAAFAATVGALDDACELTLRRTVTPWDNSARWPWGGTRFDRRSAYPEIIIRFIPY